MIKYIGDISERDAELLKDLAEVSESILEFGVGASTQVVASYTKGSVTSIDTDPAWIARTKRNLEILKITPVQPIEFFDYQTFMASPKGTYDFIFNDGLDSLRRPFALAIWPYLRVGGVLCFHDTRRPSDVRNVLEVIAHHQNEVNEVYFNYCSSNITVLYKKDLEQWEDWTITEHRLPWQLGYGDPPPDALL